MKYCPRMPQWHENFELHGNMPIIPGLSVKVTYLWVKYPSNKSWVHREGEVKFFKRVFEKAFCYLL